MKEALLGLAVAILRPSAALLAKLLLDLVEKTSTDIDDKAVADLVAALAAEQAKRAAEKAAAAASE